MNSRFLNLGAVALLTAAIPGPGMTQQVTGTLGSPSATTAISNTQLPPPKPIFGGVIKPVFLWNLVDLERLKWEGTEALTPGRHTVEFDFKYDGLGSGTLAFNDFSGVGRPGTGTLKVDGKVVAAKAMPKTLPMILQWGDSFDIGSDTLTGVNDADYQPHFPLTAKLNRLTIKVNRPQFSPDDIRTLQQATRNNKASE